MRQNRIITKQGKVFRRKPSESTIEEYSRFFLLLCFLFYPRKFLCEGQEPRIVVSPLFLLCLVNCISVISLHNMHSNYLPSISSQTLSFITQYAREPISRWNSPNQSVQKTAVLLKNSKTNWGLFLLQFYVICQLSIFTLSLVSLMNFFS